jgi:putative DNA primase/helicase
MVPVDADHSLLVAEAGRDGRNGLTAAVLFGKGEETLGMQRVAFALGESRAAAVEAWAAVNGCPPDRLHRALLQMASELEMLVREVEAHAKTKPTDDKATGEVLRLSDPEPWPEPVDVADVLVELRDLFARYLVLPVGAAVVMALWVAHTYIFDRFDHTGFLAIVSPQRRSGKTTTLTVVSSVVSRPLPAGNVSPAAVYRVIQDQRPTLLVDELDRVARDSDLWTVLNAGHTRGTPVIRTSGDNLEPRSFATFGPKCLCYIRKARTSIPDTVEDRSIRVMIQRQTTRERRPKVRSRVLAEEAGPIRSRLVRWARDLGENDLSLPDVPAVLDDRAADSWEPLLAVAATAGGEWPGRAADLAVRFSAVRAGEETEGDIGALLLADLATLVENERLDLSTGLSAEEAVHELAALRDRPWSAFGRLQKPITTTALARLLKGYGLESRPAGPKMARVRRYATEDLLDVLGRYVVSDSVEGAETRTPAHPPETVALSDSKQSGVRVCDSKPHTGRERDGVLPFTPEVDPTGCPKCGRDSCDGECS